MNIKLRIGLFVLFIVLFNTWMYLDVIPSEQKSMNSHIGDASDSIFPMLIGIVLLYRAIMSWVKKRNIVGAVLFVLAINVFGWA